MSRWITQSSKRLWLSIVTVLVVAGLGAAYQAHAEDVWNLDRLLARVDAYRWQSAVKQDPTNHEAWFRLGVDYYVMRDLTGALSAYNKATEIWPDNYVAWNNLGNVRRDLFDFWAAEDAYLKSIAIKPDYVAPYINLADLYVIWPMDEEGEKQAQKIVPLLQKGIDVNPDSEELQTALKAYVSANK